MGHDEHDASKSAAMTGGFNEGTWLEETLRLFTLPLPSRSSRPNSARAPPPQGAQAVCEGRFWADVRLLSS
jgi:hypothetical protein